MEGQDCHRRSRTLSHVEPRVKTGKVLGEQLKWKYGILSIRQHGLHIIRLKIACCVMTGNNCSYTRGSSVPTTVPFTR